jgi:hypothetical protein
MNALRKLLIMCQQLFYLTNYEKSCINEDQLKNYCDLQFHLHKKKKLDEAGFEPANSPTLRPHIHQYSVINNKCLLRVS